MVFHCTFRGMEKMNLFYYTYGLVYCLVSGKGNYLSMNKYRFMTLFATFDSIDSHSLRFKAIHHIVFVSILNRQAANFLATIFERYSETVPTIEMVSKEILFHAWERDSDLE